MITRRGFSLLLLVGALCIAVPGLAKVIKEYYPNGKTMAEVKLKGWKLDGITRSYYETGELREETEYKKNRPLHKKVYYLNGHLKEEWDYTAVTDPDDLAKVKYYGDNETLIEEKIVKKKKHRKKKPKQNEVKQPINAH